MPEVGDTIRIEQLLRVLIQLNARSLYPEGRIREVVGGSASQIRAYNLCDGTLTQAQVAKQAGLDSGNFSRTVGRWVREGVLFKIGDPNEERPLHLYPLPTEASPRP